MWYYTVCFFKYRFRLHPGCFEIWYFLRVVLSISSYFINLFFISEFMGLSGYRSFFDFQVALLALYTYHLVFRFLTLNFIGGSFMAWHAIKICRVKVCYKITFSTVRWSDSYLSLYMRWLFWVCLRYRLQRLVIKYCFGRCVYPKNWLYIFWGHVIGCIYV
jgi:hypothetical protein